MTAAPSDDAPDVNVERVFRTPDGGLVLVMPDASPDDLDEQLPVGSVELVASHETACPACGAVVRAPIGD